MANVTVAAIIQARMTSSRLPGKVMMTSCGKPLLEHLIERLKRVPGFDRITIATTNNTDDDCLEALADRVGIDCFRGSEDDVLGRVVRAAESIHADVVVELTGDCPLIDPGILQKAIEVYLANPDTAVVMNDQPQTYPLGMNTAVYPMRLLEQADREGDRPEDREHLGYFFVRQPNRFRIVNQAAPPGLHWPDLRLTLDEMDDYVLIDHLFEALYPTNPAFTCADVIGYLRRHPDRLKINAHVQQRGYESSQPHAGDCHRAGSHRPAL